MNTNDLIAAIEKLYTCVDGPPRAFFELPLTNLSVSEPYSSSSTDVLRLIYVSVGANMIGSAEETMAVLCGWAYRKLRERLTEELAEMRLVLFWRKKPVLAEFIDPNGRVCTQLRMRLIIPGINLGDIAVAEGAHVPWL